jgi:hypothetical protein
MADTQPGPPAARRDLFEALAPYRQQVAIGLLIAAALLLAVPITAFVRQRGAAWLVIGWGSALVVYLLASAAVYASAGPLSRIDETDRLRLLALALGGGLGFLTAAFGLLMPFYMPGYPEVFAGGVAEWRQHPRALAWTGLALFGGLGLMFLGLMLARTFERSRANLRRLMYGCNAALTSMLLLAILGLINVLPYSGVYPFSLLAKSYDWTTDSIYTLSDSTINQLKGLKEPVQVYALLNSKDRLVSDVETMLENCHLVTPKFTYEFVSPERDPRRVMNLVEKYNLEGVTGLLVVYGGEGNAVWEFIRRDDLVSGNFQNERGGQINFTGETAIMNALDSLSSGKAKAHIYFTQGNDELDLDDDRQPALSMTDMYKSLAQGNVELHKLTFGANAAKVPDDADVVVIAGPRRPLSPTAIAALRDYMQGPRKKKGKLLVLLDVVVVQGKMMQTGLEPLLRELGVAVGNDRVCVVNGPDRNDPKTLLVATDKRSNNDLARAFIQRNGQPQQFVFRDARSVEPAAERGGQFVGETLFQVYPASEPWRETNLDADPLARAADFRRKPESKAGVVSEQPISMAVAVTEPKSGGGADPHDFMKREPRLIVFGDATWASDELLGTPFGQRHYNLFESSLNYLRGKERLGEGQKPGAPRREYFLKVPEGGSVARILVLPGGLLLLAIVGLGCGVWVVRRR